MSAFQWNKNSLLSGSRLLFSIRKNMSKKFIRPISIVLIIISVLSSAVQPQTLNSQITSGKRYNRVVIRNAIIIDGNGTPASGPKDIVIVGDTISEIVGIDPVAV